MDTMTYLSKIWLKYLDGKATIAEVVAEYEKNGFDACQDIPGNYHWKELYDHLGPDTKVILTVRDDTDRWWNSYVNFFTQETELSFQIYFLCSINYASKMAKRFLKTEIAWSVLWRFQ